MALQDSWTYDHAPQSTTDISQGTTLSAYSETGTYNQYSGLPGMLFKNTGGTGYINTDGFVYLVSSASWNPALLVRANEVQDWTNATKYWIGFRTKLVTAQNAANSQMFNISSNLAQTNFTTMILESDMTAAGAATIGTEYYVEVMVDRQNLLYEVWIAGVKAKSGALTAASVTANGAGYYFWGAMNSASAVANATRAYRDFYFLNVDATTPNRIGSVRSAPQSLASVTAPNYTVTSGSSLTPLQVLSAAYPAPPVATPNLTSAATNDTLTAGLTGAASKPILAMDFRMGASCTQTGQVASQLVQNSNTLNLPSYAFADTSIGYGRRLGFSTKAPDGGVWTPAKISATQVLLTPNA